MKITNCDTHSYNTRFSENITTYHCRIPSNILFSHGLLLNGTNYNLNTRKRNNNTTENQKEKKTRSYRRKVKLDCQMYSKQTNLKGVHSCNKMWSLKSLVMLKWESRTSLYAVKYKWQPGSALMFCPYYFRNGKPRHFVLMFCGTASLALFLACS